MTDNPLSTADRVRRLPDAISRASRLWTNRGNLWSNPAFLRIWLANAIDDFGTHISGLAIPLAAVIALGAGPVEMGLLAAAQRLPYFALGLFAGVLVDRINRQPLMVKVNWVRAALLTLIPVAAAVGVLRIELLYLVAVLAGACGIVFDVAYVSWLPSLVEREDLHDANGKMEATYASAQAAGPGIAGIIIGLVSAPFAIAIDAISFVVSGALIRSIRPIRSEAESRPERARTEGGPVVQIQAVIREIVAGVAVAWGDVYVRVTTACSTLVSFFGYAFLAVYILFMADVLLLGPTTIGMILGAGGIGAVIGAATTTALSRRFGFGPTMIWAQIVFAVMGITVPIAVYVPVVAAPMLALSEFAQYGALAVFSIGQVSLRQVRTRPEMLGRVTASARTAAGGAALLGSIMGGLLGDWIGLGQTLVLGVAGMALACFVVIFSPLRTLRELSQLHDDAAA